MIPEKLFKKYCLIDEANTEYLLEGLFISALTEYRKSIIEEIEAIELFESDENARKYILNRLREGK